MHGLKVCPDLDTLMYTLGDGIDTERGWGRTDETWHAKDELAAYGVEPTWFGLGDRDIATHLVRTQMLDAGYPLSQVTEALCRRWLTPARESLRLLPMTDDRTETHVVIDEPDGGRRAVHFQEYWIRLHADVPASEVVVIGLDTSSPAPGVVEAITDADLVIVPPSNPIVSVGPILGVPGVREACAPRRHPWSGSPASSAATTSAAWPARCSASAASRSARRGWPSTTAPAPRPACSTAGWSTPSTPTWSSGSRRRASPAASVPLMMTDQDATADMAAAAVDLVRR